MNRGKKLLLAFSTCQLAVSSVGWAQDLPGVVGKHQNDPGETFAIEHLLSVYTKSVSDGNEAAFSSILLNDRVPFSSTDELHLAKADPLHVQMSHYSDFKHIVFESGRHFEQTFYNVRIEQDGDLAQVSLDFVTKDTRTHSGGYGWKSLTLLKVKGLWKIASEFYTVYSLPQDTGPNH